MGHYLSLISYYDHRWDLMTLFFNVVSGCDDFFSRSIYFIILNNNKGFNYQKIIILDCS